MAVAHPSPSVADRPVSHDDGLESRSDRRAKVVFEAADGQQSERRRILFVSSAGGHLAQLLQLRPWWADHDRQWVSFDLPDARSKLEGETLIPAYYPTTRNIVNLARNTPLAWRVLRDFKPDVVISNGAGVALPFFAVAKALGVPTVYLEVYDRIDSQTMTGKLCRPLASMFCVQWPEQQDLYAGSNLTGPLY